ncbi:taste receptor type 2 member 1-like [Pseudophryne corroboree]|uniref:taste receptor type 2 member 1-like n=1 Tax=Pseudophryne corroboree TaxID=495146 RepID=UPI0030819BF8
MFAKNNQTQHENATSTSTHSSTLTTYDILSLLILVLETVVGILVNGFIMIVNLIDLVTHRKLGSCDSILACLGLARFSFMLLVLAVYFVSYLYPNLANSQSAINNLQYTWLFFNDICMWLATWLCIFYCVRIVKIQVHIYVIFKTHFDHWVPYFLLASVAISAFCSNSSTYTCLNNFVNLSKFDQVNKSTQFILGGSDYSTFSTLSVVGTLPPFLLFCAAAGLVVGSLLRHTTKMKAQEKTGFREPSLNAHYRAVKMMTAFFILFLFYMVAFNLNSSGVLSEGIWFCFCTIIIGAYPSLHSILLVNGNQKLKQVFMRILQKTKFYKQDLTPTETLSD